MAGSLQYSVGVAFTAGHHSLKSHAGGNEALGYIKIVFVHAEVVLRVCNCSVQKLCEILTSRLGSVLQDTAGNIHVLAADKIQNDLYLAGGDANELQIRSCFFSFQFSFPP